MWECAAVPRWIMSQSSVHSPHRIHSNPWSRPHDWFTDGSVWKGWLWLQMHFHVDSSMWIQNGLLINLCSQEAANLHYTMIYHDWFGKQIRTSRALQVYSRNRRAWIINKKTCGHMKCPWTEHATTLFLYDHTRVCPHQKHCIQKTP